MPSLIANRRLAYGTRRLQAGDRFPASKQEARVLVALGSARYVTAEAAPKVVKQDPPADDVPVLASPSADAQADVALAPATVEDNQAAEAAPSEVEQKPADAQKPRKAKK